MNTPIDEQILAELRRTRYTGITFTIIALLVGIAGIFSIPYISQIMRPSSPPSSTKTEKATYVYTWKDVQRAEDQLDYDNAISILRDIIIKKYPNDYYAYEYMGRLHVVTGRFEEAEQDFEKAHRIWPSETSQKALDSIKIKNKRPNKALQLTPSRDAPVSYDHSVLGH